MSRTSRHLVLLLPALLSGLVLAWQIQPKPLPERVADAAVIVVAQVKETHSKARSPIDGVGDIWDVTLDVRRTLKGSLVKDARVMFSDSAVEDRPAFKAGQLRVWLLKGGGDPKRLGAPSSYESIVLLSRESAIVAALGVPSK